MDPRAKAFAALTKLMQGMPVPADNPLIAPDPNAQPPMAAQPDPAQAPPPESDEDRFARIRAMMKGQ
jgi:hypothetical protein